MDCLKVRFPLPLDLGRWEGLLRVLQRLLGEMEKTKGVETGANASDLSPVEVVES